MQKVIFRTDGSTAVGMGHVIRCLALAEMLKNTFRIIFAVQRTDSKVLEAIRELTENVIQLPVFSDYEEDAKNFSGYLSKGDIVVLDGYHFHTVYQEMMLSKFCKLVCIDDLHSWHQVADVVINQAEGISYSDYSSEPYTKIYSGLEYCLLRKSFLGFADPLRKIDEVKNVFISMGAADVHNLSQGIVDALLLCEGIEEIHLMLGAVNPHAKKIKDISEEYKRVKVFIHENVSEKELVEVLKNCHAAICPASTIALECCAVGIPLFTGITAKNQQGLLTSICKHKAAVELGDLLALKGLALSGRLSRYFEDKKLLNELMRNQRTMIDGKSSERINKMFYHLELQNLRFRFATMEDVDLYFNWTNDPLVRENSFNQKEVSGEEHQNWFGRKLASEECIFYLFFNIENIPVGQVRIDKSKDETVIGVSIDKAFRGKSLGAEMLDLATSDYLRKHPAETIWAYIKEKNEASKSIFLKAGFKVKQLVLEQGTNSFKLYKN